MDRMDELMANASPELRAMWERAKAEPLAPREFSAETWAAARDLDARTSEVRDRFVAGEIDEAASEAAYAALTEGVSEEVLAAASRLLRAEAANLQRGDEPTEA